jgi:hypothetical protein
MGEEIQILLEASANGCLIVEKESHVLWERDELLEARQNGRYRETVKLLPPDESVQLSGPFTGCMQLAGAKRADLDFRLLGQTPHFAIFTKGSEGPVLDC